MFLFVFNTDYLWIYSNAACDIFPAVSADGEVYIDNCQEW